MKNEKHTLTPKLRFPEFKDGPRWEAVNGDELFALIDRRPAKPGLPILAITQEHGAIPRDLIDYHVSVTETSIASYKEVQPMDFIISLRSFQGGIEYSHYNGICSPAYLILKRKGLGSDDYFRYLFKSDRFIQQLTRNIEGLRDGKMISYKQFSEQLLPTPEPVEQRKIAACLTSLDKWIAIEERKLEALRTHKKGLMQQLFPREGETRPRLRLPPFCDRAEWNERALGDLVTFQSGSTPSKANAAFWTGSTPWVSAKDMKQLLLEDTEDHISIAALKDGAKIAPAGALLVLIRGMTLLKDVPVCYLQREMSFNQDVRAVSTKGELNALYLAHYLVGNKQRMLRMVDRAGHGTGRLETEKLRAFGVALPALDEQQRIASCLSSLDVLVATQSQKLDGLRAHKKGAVQQLFPSPVEG